MVGTENLRLVYLNNVVRYAKMLVLVTTIDVENIFLKDALIFPTQKRSSEQDIKKRMENSALLHNFLKDFFICTPLSFRVM